MLTQIIVLIFQLIIIFLWIFILITIWLLFPLTISFLTCHILTITFLILDVHLLNIGKTWINLPKIFLRFRAIIYNLFSNQWCCVWINLIILQHCLRVRIECFIILIVKCNYVRSFIIIICVINLKSVELACTYLAMLFDH